MRSVGARTHNLDKLLPENGILYDDIKQFVRDDTLLCVGNNDYTATVIVGTTKSGYMLLYDIINLNLTTIIERNGKKDTATEQRKGEVSRSAVSTATVLQSDTSVNLSIRKNVQGKARVSEKHTSAGMRARSSV